MSKRDTPSKHWCFTINNPSEEDRKIDAPYTYLVMGNEVGEAGTPHIQGYVTFEVTKRLSGVAKLLPRAHLEKMYSTPAEASAYCKKEGDFKEEGTISLTKEQGTKRHWEDMWENAKSGDIENIPHQHRIQHYHAIKRIQQDYMQRPGDLSDVCGEWHYGAPGTGKSHSTRADNPGFYDKPLNKWWDGYQGEDVVIIDDLGRKQGEWIGDLLKRWSDRYSFPAEIKGTTHQLRPKKIIVTSNYTIREIFLNDEQLCQALERRFKSTHHFDFFKKK